MILIPSACTTHLSCRRFFPKVIGQMNAEDKDAAGFQHGTHPRETGEGILLGEQIFKRADETMHQIKAPLTGHRKRFHAVLPDQRGEIFPRESVPRKVEHGTTNIEASDLPMSVREFREEASAAAGEFQHGSIFGDTVSVSVVESLKESRLKGGVFVKNDVVVERGLVPVLLSLAAILERGLTLRRIEEALLFDEPFAKAVRPRSGSRGHVWSIAETMTGVGIDMHLCWDIGLFVFQIDFRHALRNVRSIIATKAMKAGGNALLDGEGVRLPGIDKSLKSGRLL